MKIRILFVGDIHLGRVPARIPKVLAERGLQPGDLAPAAAWEETVRWALQKRPDAVVLAGNVVESVEDLFEAYGDLSQGVRRLVKEGIRVFGVAGSKDVSALPLLADRLPEFRLLGRGGKWEFARLQPRERESMRLLGWSFPAPEVAGDPLEDLPDIPGEGGPVLGVLQATVGGGAGCAAAPVSRTALEEAAVDGWLLGQSPQPDPLAAPRPVGYLGSLVPSGPEEDGCHGPWLVTVFGPGEIEAEQVPLSPVRWERDELAVSGLDEAADLGDAFVGALHAALKGVVERVGDDLGGCRAVGCRLRLTGETRRHREIAELITAARVLRTYEEQDSVPFFIECIEDETSPALELEDLARARDPLGLLAGRLLALKQGGPEADEILAAAARDLAAVAENHLWSGLEPLEAETREILIAAGTRALEDLLAQREAAGMEVLP